MTNPHLLTADEVAAMAGVHRTTVCRLCRIGKLNAIRANGAWWVPRRDATAAKKAGLFRPKQRRPKPAPVQGTLTLNAAGDRDGRVKVMIGISRGQIDAIRRTARDTGSTVADVIEAAISAFCDGCRGDQ